MVCVASGWLTSGCGGAGTLTDRTAAVSQPSTAHVTIGISGQSNADFLTPFLEDVDTVVGFSESSRPIESWDEPNGYMWMHLLPALSTPMRAFVWWQGEADYQTTPGYYGQKLADVVRRVRAANRNPSLLVAVLELGPYYNGSTSKDEGRAWALADRHAIYVQTNDIPFKDGIHMPDDSYRLVAARVDQMIRARLAH